MPQLLAPWALVRRLARARRRATDREELRTRVEQLVRDLGAAYERLQSSGVELGTTSEELQSAVGELESTNEALQSVNEELENMNGELQSTNEALQTLNDALRVRTLQVHEAYGYLKSALESLDQSVVVIDADFRVQLWNAAVERLTGLRSFEAEGLRLTDLSLGLAPEAVRRALHGVIREGHQEAQLQQVLDDPSGAHAMRHLKVTSLRRESGDAGGGVVVLNDVVAQ